MGMPVKGSAEAAPFSPFEAGDLAVHDSEKLKRTVGERLAAARLSQGLSLEQVFGGTKVKIIHLTAIEEGDRASLPAVPYTAGFIKAYAKFLGFDPETLARDYRVEVGATSPPIKIEAATIVRQRASSPVMSQKAASTLAVGAAVFFALWFAASTLPQGAHKEGPARNLNAAQTAPAPKPHAASLQKPGVASAPAAPKSKPLTQPTPSPEIQKLSQTPASAETAAVPTIVPSVKSASNRRTEASILAKTQTRDAGNDAEALNQLRLGGMASNASDEDSGRQPVIALAKLTRPAAPRYPERCANRAAAEESIDVVIDVMTDGKPSNPRISRSSNDCFNAAATDTVNRMRFSPRAVDGEPSAEFGKTVTVRFVR